MLDKFLLHGGFDLILVKSDRIMFDAWPEL